jgi:hypothetical protein
MKTRGEMKLHTLSRAGLVGGEWSASPGRLSPDERNRYGGLAGSWIDPNSGGEGVGGILSLTGIELRFSNHLPRRVFTVDLVIELEGFAVHSDHRGTGEPTRRELHLSHRGTRGWSAWPAESWCWDPERNVKGWATLFMNWTDFHAQSVWVSVHWHTDHPPNYTLTCTLKVYNLRSLCTCVKR